MGTHFDLVRNLVSSNSFFNRNFLWKRLGSGAQIPNCIDSKEASKVFRSFSSASSIDVDRLFALTEILLASVSDLEEPKAFSHFDVDFNGVYDFYFEIEGYTKVLKNKKPVSKPRRDPKKAKYVPEYKDTKISYCFGLEYDPRNGLIRIRYKIYPRKDWRGFC